jgi:protein-S-isoprenylcysteine O-methyltransferase Ste14
MPLSEQEQRLLDEMERHLMRNDADVVTAPNRALSYRNIVYGTILVLLGLGGLIFGVSAGLTALGIIVGVVGFVVMLGGVILAVTPMRGSAPTPTATAPSAPRARPGSSFMDRMNDRWDRRQEGR